MNFRNNGIYYLDISHEENINGRDAEIKKIVNSLIGQDYYDGKQTSSP